MAKFGPREDTPNLTEILLNPTQWEAKRDALFNRIISQREAARAERLDSRLKGEPKTEANHPDLKLKRLLGTQGIFIKSPFVIPKDPKKSQGGEIFGLNLGFIKAMRFISGDRDKDTAIQLETLHSSHSLSEISQIAIETTKDKKDLCEGTIAETAEKMLGEIKDAEEDQLIMNLLPTVQEEAHSFGIVVLKNQQGLWLQDPLRGVFHFKNDDQEAFKKFITDYIAQYYPEHVDASLVQIGTKKALEVPASPSAQLQDKTDIRKTIQLGSQEVAQRREIQEPKPKEKQAKETLEKGSPPKPKPK